MTEAEEARGAVLIDRIVAARKKNRRIRLLLGGLVFAVFCYFGYRIYRTFGGFDQKAFMTHLNRNAASKVWPAIQFELQRVGREAAPALAKEFARRVEADWPKFEQAVDKQTEALGKNLRGKTPEVLATFVKETGKQSRAAIEAAFPEVKDPAQIDALVGKLTFRMGTWSQHQYAMAVEEHIKAMIGIKSTLAAFRPEDGGGGVAPEDVLALTLEVLEVRMGGGGAPATPMAAKTAAKR